MCVCVRAQACVRACMHACMCVHRSFSKRFSKVFSGVKNLPSDPDIMILCLVVADGLMCVLPPDRNDTTVSQLMCVLPPDRNDTTVSQLMCVCCTLR